MNIDSLISAASFTPKSLQFPNSWIGHLPFAAWVIQEVSPKIFVELGTHTGNSYFSCCQAVVESGISTKCYAVDTWQGDDHAGQYTDKIFAEVNDYHHKNYVEFSSLLRMTFDDAVNYFSDESIDLLHIDGLHTYEAVKHDFETWLPKLAPDAIVMFHDTNVRERGFGVWKFWEELQARYPNNLEFVHSHGLGVLQLNNAPDNRKLEWLEPSSSEKKNLIHYFSELGSRQLECYELNQLKQQTVNLNQIIAERETAVTTLNQVIAERETAVATLNQVVAEREGTIMTLNQVLTGRDADIVMLNQLVVKRDADIVTLNRVIIERETAVATLNQVIAEREAVITTLNQRMADYQAVLRSSSWKITIPWRFLGHLVKGNFDPASQMADKAIRRIIRPLRDAQYYIHQRLIDAGIAPTTSNNEAINAIVVQRCSFTKCLLAIDPLSLSVPKILPNIDISVVTYNSSRWISAFIESLIELDYPKNLLIIRFVDNSSTDSTLNDLHEISPTLIAAGCSVEIMKRPNHGYGAGHNAAIISGTAPFCLVTNIDLTFEPDALSRIIAVAEADNEAVAAWEMRQKPYEHPKYYDPITGLTNWNSHACVLLRRSAISQVGFYDKALFMYGEDVELSYRLRRAGFLLRYCPQAVVWHYSYEDVTKIKPLQYTGSTFANLYLRLKYGNRTDVMMVPWMSLRLLRASAYPGSRLAVMRNLLYLLLLTPKTLLGRQSSQVYFPFRVWDYDLIREGAFVEQQPLPNLLPLVSIITRTYRGRELYLRQALLSAVHQTYPNIEYIVVEDGGDTMQAVVDNINQVTERGIRFIGLPKCGRSVTGNAGLAAATGRWCLFLDDDDLLFSDHIETLVTALLGQPDVVAAYSPAWEIMTDTLKLQNGEYVETSHKTPETLSQEFDYKILRHHNYMAIQSVLFERFLFEQCGGFEDDMDALEDWVLWVKYATGNRFQYVPKVTSMYRIPASHPDRVTRHAILDKAYSLAQQKLSIYLGEEVKGES